MKITIEHNGTECAVNDPDAVTLSEAMELVKQALLGIGFQSANVEAWWTGGQEPTREGDQ